MVVAKYFFNGSCRHIVQSDILFSNDKKLIGLVNVIDWKGNIFLFWLILFHDLQSFIVFQKINPRSHHTQFTNLHHVKKSCDDGFISEIKSLDAFVVSQVPYFDFTLVITWNNHGSFFDNNKICDEILMTQQLSFQVCVQVLVINLKNVYFLFEPCR